MSNVTFSKMMPISDNASDGSEMWALAGGIEFACVTWLGDMYEVDLIDCGRVIEIPAHKPLEAVQQFVRDIYVRMTTI